jgi:2-oxo-3-hexenedioate decarboxylase
LLPETELRTIADEIKSAQEEVRQIEPFSARHDGFDMASAYAVAHLNHEARVAAGAVPVGRKIGFTNTEMWTQYGVSEPVWAIIYDQTVVRLTSAFATCALGQFTEPKIEPEIVLHFGKAPPAGGNVAAILECVDWIAHAFEIVQCHFPGWRFRAADTVADWALHGTLLVGEPQSVDQLGADLIERLASFSIELSCDGAVRENGKGANVLGSPLAAVASLIALLERQPRYRPVQAGEIVTTGTLTRALPVRAGETWRTGLQGIALPGLSLALTD